MDARRAQAGDRLMLMRGRAAVARRAHNVNAKVTSKESVPPPVHAGAVPKRSGISEAAPRAHRSKRQTRSRGSCRASGDVSRVRVSALPRATRCVSRCASHKSRHEAVRYRKRYSSKVQSSTHRCRARKVRLPMHELPLESPRRRGDVTGSCGVFRKAGSSAGAIPVGPVDGATPSLATT